MKETSHLIKACAANDRMAQEQLYRLYYTPLFLLCKRFFHDNSDAMECLNDGMLKVYTGIQRFDETKGTLFNWMYTVIRNTALDKLKMAQLPATIEIDHAIVVSSDEHILKTLDWKDMYRLLDALPQATRAVCSLFYIEGFKIKEIAESLGISAGTVKWHLAETRSKLKVVFHNQYH